MHAAVIGEYHLIEPARLATDFVGREIAHGPVLIVAEHFAERQFEVAYRVRDSERVREIDRAFAPVGIVAFDAVFIEQRLNIAHEVVDVGDAVDGRGRDRLAGDREDLIRALV